MSKYTRKPRYATNDVYNATEGAYNVVEPPEAKKDLGHDYKEKPPRQYFNWLARQGHQWLDYLDDEINQFAAHAADPADMTVIIDAGRLNGSTGPTVVAAQTTIAFVAPSAGNLRIDRIVIDQETGAHSVLTGVEDPTTPVAPAIASGKLAVCQVALSDSTTSITDDDIEDERVAFDSITRGGTITGDIVHTGDVAQTGDYVLTGDLTIATDLIVTSSVGATLDIVATTGITGDTSITGDLIVNTNDLFIDTATGKVGIGTATPDSGLSVAAAVRVENSTLNPTTGEGLELAYATSTHEGIVRSYDRTGAAYKVLHLEGNQIILNGGASLENYTVGVGTNSPHAGGASFSNLQVGRSAWLMAGEGSGTGQSHFWIGGNAYFDTGWKVNDTGYAAVIDGGDGINLSTDDTSRTAGTAATLTVRLNVNRDGGVSIGSPTGGSKGAGTLNVQSGIYADGKTTGSYSVDGSTSLGSGGGTDITVTHGLGTDDVIIEVMCYGSVNAGNWTACSKDTTGYHKTTCGYYVPSGAIRNPATPSSGTINVGLYNPAGIGTQTVYYKINVRRRDV